jgi:hypothetical protein
MVRWWNVNTTTPSGIKINRAWHLRQMLFALIAPVTAFCALEIAKRWEGDYALIRQEKEAEKQQRSGAGHHHKRKIEKTINKTPNSEPAKILVPSEPSPSFPEIVLISLEKMKDAADPVVSTVQQSVTSSFHHLMKIIDGGRSKDTPSNPPSSPSPPSSPPSAP